MATIETSIRLKDGVSPALQSMNRALNIVLNTLQSVSAGFQRPIDVAAFNTARNELARAAVHIENLETGTREAVVAQNQLAQTTAKVAQTAEQAVASQNDFAATAQLSQYQMAQIDKKVAEIALAKDKLAEKEQLLANLRADEEADLSRISRLEKEIANDAAGIALKHEAIGKIVSDNSKATSKATRELVQQQLNADRLASSANRVKVTEEAIATQTQRTNNEKAKGVNIAKQGELIAKRTADFEQRKAAREQTAYQKTWNAIQKTAQAYAKRTQKLQQEAAITKMVASTQERYATAIGRVNQKYDEAKQKVLQLERSVDRTNKLEIQQLQSARAVSKERQKIVDLTNRLVQTRIKLNTLEIQGKNNGLQALMLRHRENSIKGKIANSSRTILNIERQIKAATDQTTQAQNRHNAAMRNGVSASNMLWTKAKQLVGTYMGIQAAGKIIGLSDQLTMTTARLDLMNDGLHTTKQLQDGIYEAAMRSRAGYFDMAAAVSKIGIQAGSLFKSGGKMNNAAIIQFMENYNKMAAISGASTQQTAAAMHQIVQALSSGELRGDELRSVLENMPVVAQYLAKELDVPVDKIRELGFEGKISAEKLRNAVMNATDDLNEKMKKIPYTWGQVWEITKNVALKAFEPILRAINNIIKTDRFKRFATSVGNVMTKVAGIINNLWNLLSPLFAWIFDAVAGICNFIRDNWSFIAPIIGGIAAALVILKGKLALVWLWTKAVELATKAWGVAQAIVNAIMAMNPVGLVCLAIVALIVLIYIVVAAINKVRDTAISATGIIFGSVMWLGAAIWNIVAWLINVIIGSIFALAVIIANIVIGIMNVVSGVVQAIVNAWNWCCDNVGIIFDNIGIWWTNMWADCYTFFCDFITKVLNKLSSLAEYVQPFAEVLGMDITGKLGKIKKGVSNARDEIASKKQGYKSLKSFKDINWKSVDYLSVGNAWDTGYNSLGYLNLGNAYDKGYDFGKNVDDKVKGFFSGKSLENLSDVGDLAGLEQKLDNGKYENDLQKALDNGFADPNVKNPALDKIADDTGNIADNTGATADNTASSDEDLKYMRRLAEREAMNRYQLTDLKVEMTNNNSISSNVDADKVMLGLVKQITHAAKTNAESAFSFAF